MSGMRIKLLSLAAILFIAFLPWFGGNFYVTLFNYIGIYALVSLGLVLLTGAGGLISFGQAAFVGIGAYSTAVLTTKFGLSPWIGLPVALILSGLVAVILGFVTLRLSGHYLALLTIAWGMTIYLIFGNLQFLGGHSGIIDIPPLTAFGISLESNARYFYLIWPLVGLAMLLANWLLESRQGRAIRALRGGKVLAESLGIDVFRLRLSVFTTAALLAGLAGWLYAHMQRYIGPTPFDLSVGIEFLLMAVIGGAGWVGGALLGAIVITSLRTVLQDLLPLLTSRAGNLEIVVYGCIFIVMLQYARSGLFGLLAPYLGSGAPIRQSAATSLPRRVLPQKGKELLRVEGLTKRFGGLVAVDHVDFSVNAGEIVGLIGPNGAGKSTIFNLISGALSPSNGRIVFGGADLSRVHPQTLVKLGLARTFQHVKLRPNMTTIENVMLGAYTRTKTGFISGSLRLDRRVEAEIYAEALIQLRRVGLEAKAEELAGSLPLGQQRVVEVARALAADPTLIILDEPAAGLRRPEKKQLSELLENLRGSGMTLLLVEHDMEFVMRLVDRIVMVDFGKKLAEGLPQDIRNNPIVQEAYLGSVA
jgi:ABC-type branched-subunit amino acid transport system ATPase component/ABC-type branched-subunit amino acid transport system permease subunit